MQARLPTILALAIALLAGSAPWRVCNHADADHGFLWLPSLEHVHASCHQHEHDCDHHHHDHDAPTEPGHCHCSDAPLVTGVTFTVVQLDAPAPARVAAASVLPTLPSGAPEVAPRLLEGLRVAQQSDPIVLVR